jgi:uncharacterized RDD family membrane protein YckC
MQYVSVGRRVIAGFVDGVIVFFGFGFAIAAATSNASANGDGVSFQLDGLLALAWMGLALGYFVVLEATLGATLGKFLVGVRVRTIDGHRIGWVASLTRNLLRVIDVCFWCVGAILIWVTPRRQRLGDHAAGTVVVRPV